MAFAASSDTLTVECVLGFRLRTVPPGCEGSARGVQLVGGLVGRQPLHGERAHVQHVKRGIERAGRPSDAECFIGRTTEIRGDENLPERVHVATYFCTLKLKVTVSTNGVGTPFKTSGE